MIWIEIDLGSARKLSYNEEWDEEIMNSSLDLLKEKRNDSQINLAVYQRKVERHFNSKVRRKNFKVGDLVLKKVFITDKEKVRYC